MLARVEMKWLALDPVCVGMAVGTNEASGPREERLEDWRLWGAQIVLAVVRKTGQEEVRSVVIGKEELHSTLRSWT